MQELPLLEKVRHIANTGNLFLYYEDKMELVVEDLNVNKIEELNNLGCIVEKYEEGNFYLVTIPKNKKPNFCFLIYSVIAALIGLFLHFYYEDVYYFLYDMLY